MMEKKGKPKPKASFQMNIDEIELNITVMQLTFHKKT